MGEDKYVIRTPMPADVPITLTATGDIGDYVSALFSFNSAALPQHPVLALSERRSMAEMAAIFAHVLGKNITYDQISTAQFEKEIPGLGLMLADMYGFMADFGYCGNVQTAGTKELGIQQGELTTFEGFVKAHDWGFFFEG